MESIGFKEWALVCEALGRGEQSVILRKGGVAEGRAGFAFQHDEFFLFPTFFHEQVERIRGPLRELPRQREGEIDISYFARLAFAMRVADFEILAALEPFHVLESEVVRERFEYDDAKGIHVGVVRIFRLSEPWRFPDEPRYGGCRSWVKLPELAPIAALEPVLSDAAHATRVEQIRAALQFETAR